MRALGGVYETHKLAHEAIETLKSEGFEPSHLSLVGLAEMQEDHFKIKEQEHLLEVGVGSTVALETVIGALAGVSIVAIPGLGFLYGAGAIIGAFAGLDFGILTGGVIAILAKMGIKEEIGHIYGNYIKEGKFVVLVNGTEEEITKAHDILHLKATHTDLKIHSAIK
jgi:hypothetical protein